MTVRREIAFQGTCFEFKVSSFQSVFPDNMKPETRNPQSVPQHSGSAIAAEALMNYAGRMEFPKDFAWHSPNEPFREALEEGLCHPASASSPSYPSAS